MSSFKFSFYALLNCSYPFELLDDFLLGPLAEEESEEKEAGQEQKEGQQQNSWWETRARFKGTVSRDGFGFFYDMYG
jgi:hypothetical protein